MDQPVIQSLWIGPRLSVMEQLSIQSYLALGYAFHLYVYESVENIPAGVVVRNAAEILGTEEIFCYQSGPGKGSHAAFANGFRYKLLLERGGWWTDLDSICLRRLDFADEHVLGREHEPDGSQCVAIGLMKAPCGSPLMEKCWAAAKRANRSKLVWGQIGPRLMDEAVRTVNVPLRLLDPIAFYPVNYWQHEKLIRRGLIPAESYAIHLWHARWTQTQLNPDAKYSPHSILEQLKRRFDVPSPSGAPVGPSRQYLAQLRREQFQAARGRFKSLVRNFKTAIRRKQLLRLESPAQIANANA
jgi:hypothetical protein